VSFYDDTDKLAGGSKFRTDTPGEKNGVIIQFYHVPTIKGALEKETFKSQASFKAFLTSFKDSFKVNWNQKETFGRMDAIQTYKNTQRQMSIEFEVPSVSLQEAELNFISLQNLIQMQYPVYEMVETSKVVMPATPAVQSPQNPPTSSGSNPDRDLGAAVQKAGEQPVTANRTDVKNISKFISSPPLIYVKFLNWITNEYEMANVGNAQNALVATINEVSFSPDLEQGFHVEISDEVNKILIPKMFTISLNLTIIHTQELGWVNKVIGSTEPLTSYQFGEPKALQQETEGFADYKLFPYHMGEYSYKKDT
jgi:hypothetical protein